mmetsp:Transcript_118945/g.253733  ORF Transcript_118945/g.253733 Transcript_118945/m.253733 type:complete len:91 (+) Transcript_118945:102-374(+)
MPDDSGHLLATAALLALPGCALVFAEAAAAALRRSPPPGVAQLMLSSMAGRVVSTDGAKAHVKNLKFQIRQHKWFIESFKGIFSRGRRPG